jgi:hypothetical protein
MSDCSCLFWYRSVLILESASCGYIVLRRYNRTIKRRLTAHDVDTVARFAALSDRSKEKYRV